ncbi:hypothetical protein [Winogradskyella costae]|uniref:hypothetical protein n=1 Tax=Winogradskyella costae TaxID=2697008 RepID=UPI0015CA06AF|nr:hypothetical protein [Winogradskyella costae]
MIKIKNEFILKYGVPSLAVIVVAIQLSLVHYQNLNRWKGGGYGMYTKIHFYYDQIYIPGMSVDSLVDNNIVIKNAFRKLMIMPNDANFYNAAKLVLETTDKDSVQVQLWEPSINSSNGTYSRVLINEIQLKNQDL